MRNNIKYKGFEIKDKELIKRITQEVEEDLECLTDAEFKELKQTTGIDDLTDIISNNTFSYFEKTFGNESHITFGTWLAKHNFELNILDEMCKELQKLADIESNKIKVIYDDIDLEEGMVNIKIRLESRLIMETYSEDKTKIRTFGSYKHLRRIFMKVVKEHRENE